jgi:hypothetical protein
MFAMPSPARLLFCRVGIVAFCLLPTATVGGWIVQRTSAGYAIARKAEWERELASRLGLAVEIGAVSYPSLSLATLHDVRLLDPETGALVAEAGQVEVTAADSGWRVQLWQPRVAAERLADVLRAIDQRLLRESEFAKSPCVVLASELRIDDARGGLSLVNLEARLAATEHGPSAELAFQLPAVPANSAEPVRLSIIRNRRASPPRTVWQLDTAGHPLPIDLLVAASAEAQHLGPNCQFAGSFTFENASAGWTGECNGTLTGVDLDSLVSERFPHQLSGLATIKILGATLERSKLTEIRGTIQARDGAVSHSLLAAAQEHLGLVLVEGNPHVQPGRLVPYRQLSLGFTLDGLSLALSGSADPTQPGVLLANAAGPILHAPPQHDAASVNLLRTLLPDNQFQVPATRQTDALVGLLPVPDVLPTRTAARPNGHVPTRLTPAADSPASQPVRQPKLR